LAELAKKTHRRGKKEEVIAIAGACEEDAPQRKDRSHRHCRSLGRRQHRRGNKEVIAIAGACEEDNTAEETKKSLLRLFFLPTSEAFLLRRRSFHRKEALSRKAGLPRTHAHAGCKDAHSAFLYRHRQGATRKSQAPPSFSVFLRPTIYLSISIISSARFVLAVSIAIAIAIASSKADGRKGSFSSSAVRRYSSNSLPSPEEAQGKLSTQQLQSSQSSIITAFTAIPREEAPPFQL
jgi:hypothetical protein